MVHLRDVAASRRSEALAAQGDVAVFELLDEGPPGALVRAPRSRARGRTFATTPRRSGHGLRDDAAAVVFEGAQGVLLDEWRGFHPHTTWSTCTFDNALALAARRTVTRAR
jgi:hypothetical protein